MASRRDQHQARLAAIAALGKDLTRRAGSVCELCGPDGRDLRVIEVPPVEEDPTHEAAILACARCRELAEGGRLPRDAAELRFLEGAAWSEIEPVQLVAIRLLRRLAEADVAWAREALDGLWIPEEIEEKV